ncbi:MAG: hypothetical protein WC819_05350 [Parcubacteria group bacterium]
MATRTPVSPNAQSIIEAVMNSKNLGKDMYDQITTHAERLCETDIWNIVSYYHSNIKVVEAVIRSTILKKEVACRFLRVFSFNSYLCEAAEYAYDDEQFSKLLEERRAEVRPSGVFH